MARKSWRLFLASLLTALFVWAQAETGQVTGTITDPSGAVVAGAAIKIVSEDSGATRTDQSNQSGSYTVSNLLPGRYSLSVEQAGFTTSKQTFALSVGQKLGLDIQLKVGQSETVVQVNEAAAPVNTETQTMSTTVSQTQLRELPTITRDPYALVALSGNVSSGGAGARGVGYAINGQRESSTNVLLDGAANNNDFTATVGQSVPLDSLQEFSILTNNFTAEYGRASGGIVNVVTKAGTNDIHGTAYEFNRVSAISSNSYFDNANTLPKSVFDRNQFGYSLGGPVKKNKLFFFSSTEWIRIRSASEEIAYVPTSEFLATTSPNTQAFFNQYGKLKSNASVLQTFSLNQLAANGQTGCNVSCGSINPNLPVLSEVGYTVNGDSGGGVPENQYQTVARVDYNYSDKTQFYARYALQSTNFFPGFVSSSPYQGYDTGETDFNNNILVSGIHTFSPSFISQSKVVFNRLNDLQPLSSSGVVPTLYPNPNGPLALFNGNVLFPGYDPATPGSGVPFGGPQNYAQLYEDLTFTKGNHSLRFGGSFDYERDNRTFGAYETAGEYLTNGAGGLASVVDSLMSGELYQFTVAINPQGHYPGDTVPYPLGPPNFSRSNRYREGAAYVQDSWKLARTFTLNLGVRWEYYGVQHNKNADLDSNFSVPQSEEGTPLGIANGAATPVSQNGIGGLWKPQPHNFAPRVGFAWDVRGDGKTALRGGYGIGYERNFGNVTFNVIQNPPNYETVNQYSVPVSPNNFGPFSAASGTLTLPTAEARYVDNDIKTAYSHNWSLTLEHQVTNGLMIGVDYTGSRGVHLYDLSDVNQPGFGNVFLGIPCTPTNCTDPLNTTYGIIFRRANGGFSNYNGVNFRATLNNPWHSGLTLTANYTWSHAIDNLSSTFSDTPAQTGPGFSANNGTEITGLLDPFAPQIDKGNAEFDERQRLTMSAVWPIPFKPQHGLLKQLVGGWEMAPLFEANTGAPYSIFDCTNSQFFCSRAFFNGPLPSPSSSAGSVGADTFAYQALPPALVNNYASPITGVNDLPPYPGMSGRDAFRAPGFWDLDLGLYKTFYLGEKLKLQIRGEAFNIFNHANLYVEGANAVDTAGSVPYVPSCRACTGTSADRRNLQLAAKIIF
jgi:outer membrane receptor protein involved in Fe transport